MSSLSILAQQVETIWTPWWCDAIYLMPVGSVLQLCHFHGEKNCFKDFKIKVDVKQFGSCLIYHDQKLICEKLAGFQNKGKQLFKFGACKSFDIHYYCHLMGDNHLDTLTSNSKHISWALHAYGDIFSALLQDTTF